MQNNLPSSIFCNAAFFAAIERNSDELPLSETTFDWRVMVNSFSSLSFVVTIFINYRQNKLFICSKYFKHIVFCLYKSSLLFVVTIFIQIKSFISTNQVFYL